MRVHNVAVYFPTKVSPIEFTTTLDTEILNVCERGKFIAIRTKSNGVIEETLFPLDHIFKTKVSYASKVAS